MPAIELSLAQSLDYYANIDLDDRESQVGGKTQLTRKTTHGVPIPKSFRRKRGEYRRKDGEVAIELCKSEDFPDPRDCPKGIRVPDEKTKMIEDAVSEVICNDARVQKLMVEFMDAVSQESLESRVIAYPKGGFALNLVAQNIGLVDYARTLENSRENDIFQELKVGPRDIDIDVLPPNGLDCDMLQSCSSGNKIFNRVVLKFKDLKDKLLDHFRQDLKFIQEKIEKKLKADIDIVNLPDFHLQKKDGRPMLYIRGKKKMYTCNAENGCNLVGRSYNFMPDFTGSFDNSELRHSFALLRLAIGVRIRSRQTQQTQQTQQTRETQSREKKKTYRVNFFDISIPMETDYIYKKDKVKELPSRIGNRLSYDVRDQKVEWPSVSMGYLSNACLIQLKNLRDQNNDGLSEKIDKLERRLTLITFMSGLMFKHGMYSNRLKVLDKKVIDDYADTFSRETRRVIKNIVLNFYGASVQQDLIDFMVEVVERVLANENYLGKATIQQLPTNLRTQTQNLRTQTPNILTQTPTIRA